MLLWLLWVTPIPTAAHSRHVPRHYIIMFREYSQSPTLLVYLKKILGSHGFLVRLWIAQEHTGNLYFESITPKIFFFHEEPHYCSTLCLPSYTCTSTSRDSRRLTSSCGEHWVGSWPAELSRSTKPRPKPSPPPPQVSLFGLNHYQKSDLQTAT